MIYYDLLNYFWLLFFLLSLRWSFTAESTGWVHQVAAFPHWGGRLPKSHRKRSQKHQGFDWSLLGLLKRLRKVAESTSIAFCSYSHLHTQTNIYIYMYIHTVLYNEYPLIYFILFGYWFTKSAPQKTAGLLARCPGLPSAGPVPQWHRLLRSGTGASAPQRRKPSWFSHGFSLGFLIFFGSFPVSWLVLYLANNP